MDNPFLFDGPGLIQFSAGLTSAMMLHMALEAHGGKLPDNVRVCFENTGKEHERSLDFVHEVETRWNVKIDWLERRPNDTFAVVNYETADREGGPFAQLIAERGMVPNPVARFCNPELKVRTAHRYMRSQGFESWTTFVGLRADEPTRVAKLANNDYGQFETKEAPLAAVGVTNADVERFWKAQPFGLCLPRVDGETVHGNCDLCYLKNGNTLVTLVREKPSRAIWWATQERVARAAGAGRGSLFHIGRPSYEKLHQVATAHGELFAFEDTLEACGCTD